MDFQKAVAISTGPYTHLDHLGVLSALLSIPLIVTEEKAYHLAKEFYPKIQAELKDFSELSLDYLASFDAIFQSGKFWTLDLLPSIQLFYNKKVRFIFCPHGNSDKGHSLKGESHPPQDIALVYGNHMKDLLTKTGAWEKISTPVFSGNYRYPYYLEHKTFYDDLLEKRLFLDKKKKTIFYAPTWQDKENPSSFFLSCKDLISSLSKSFNVIVKLHPFLEEDHPQEVLFLHAFFEKIPNVNFLDRFPAIYPILAKSDIYLGDFSSIGYDFLVFDKPMFFLSLKSKNVPLHCCGMQVPLHDLLITGEFIEKNLEKNERSFSSQRKDIYEYAFGKKKGNSHLKKEILNSIFSKEQSR